MVGQGAGTPVGQVRWASNKNNSVSLLPGAPDADAADAVWVTPVMGSARLFSSSVGGVVNATCER